MKLLCVLLGASALLLSNACERHDPATLKTLPGLGEAEEHGAHSAHETHTEAAVEGHAAPGHESSGEKPETPKPATYFPKAK